MTEDEIKKKVRKGIFTYIDEDSIDMVSDFAINIAISQTIKVIKDCSLVNLDLICVELPYNNTLTIGKSYKIITKGNGYFTVDNDSGETENYSNDIFKEITKP